MSKLLNSIFLICLVFQANSVFSQSTELINSDQIEAFLKDPALNSVIKDYYGGHLILSDDDLTFELLEAITVKNDKFFPINLYTLNQIVYKSDGALAEMIPEFCITMIQNYPKRTFDFFSTNHETLVRYARSIGYELYFVEQGTSVLETNLMEFKSYLSKHLDLNEETTNQTYLEFIKEVERLMKLME